MNPPEDFVEQGISRERQFLGSPVSKLHSHGGDDTIVAEDPRCRVAEDDNDNGERKAAKPRRLSFSQSSSLPSPSASRPEKFIHLIPRPILFLVA
ncbi:hypothetical protein SLEP1_g13883 [Rubroshorea leprosula]|uniref:Uncharacterized protein n=1 Tax=Rubroshorea leprosula TaxID=152421 RepID=A0AAV5IN45_9ROSI|nr:hypothetical protein SLEP1_g13883 [Rubroshorea leprosula]